jgi:protoporphyrinogen oxidase
MDDNHAIVVLGGGLAGLSTLWHLQQRGYTDSRLFEKESRVGGLTRSEQVNGYTFDYTGHLLHFKNDAVQQLVSRLLDGNLHSVARNSWIFSKGVYTRYPFQTNLYGLPTEVVKECIAGFVKARNNHTAGNGHDAAEPMSFAAWIDSTLGPGIARHFMTPYNEKLWTVPLHELTCEWMGRFVPSTSLEQILDGALADQSSRTGYNATFSYPLCGGIEALPRAFAASLTHIHTGCELARLDLPNRQLHFKNGMTVRFHRLVTTIPLPALLRAASEVPDHVREAAQKLRFTSVCNINLGVDRNISDKHWIYFPEPEYCFYRIGFSHNFSPNQAPAGCSAIYAEVGYSEWKPLNRTSLVERIKSDLTKAGILQPTDRVMAELCLDIPCAYVIYDRHHRRCSDLVRTFLRENGILTVGRYGAWEYSGMEDAIWQGRLAAEEILA